MWLAVSWIPFLGALALEGAASRAAAMDGALVRLARGRGAVDLAIGEALLRLSGGDGLLRLGYSRLADYARERLGVPARTAFFWARVARVVRDRTLLRRAVACGAVTPRKALVVADLARGEAAVRWVHAAMTMTESELRARARGGTADEFEVETLVLRMSPDQQDRLDRGLAAAREILGAGTPRWQWVEAIAMEWLGTFAGWQPESALGARANGVRFPDPVVNAPSALALDRQLAALEESMAVLGAGAGADPTAPEELDARLLRLLSARRCFDEPFGALLAEAVERKVWRQAGFPTLEEYCRDRLGLAPRTVRERVWLERRMCALPALRRALRAGRITFSKALLVARDASPEDVEGRIAVANSTTWQQLERDSTAEEDRRNRARGVRRLWGPREAAETVVVAIATAQALGASLGEHLPAGEALALMADHFVAVWSEHRRRARAPRRRRELLERQGGLCAVPGCSRAAEHVHHIRFRSRGGSDEDGNRVGLCPAHHLRGVHRGRLEITGRAGERLVWRFGDGEAWETEGEDDVRRIS